MELQELLSEIESIVNNSDFTDIVWGSDLNWGMDRNTYFASRVREFVDRLGVIPLWTHHPIDYTHVHTDNKSVATLDHFLVSPRLLSLVNGCGVLHRGDNFSRHSPIWLTLNLGNHPKRENVKRFALRKPAWSKATEVNVQSFTTMLEARLELLIIPESLNCQNPHCSDTIHSQQRDSFTLDIDCNIVECSHLAIPLTGGRNGAGAADGRGTRGGLPGWEEELEPFRQESIYWHNIWLRECRPSHGWLHDTMVKRRTQYHYVVRRLERSINLLCAKKLFESALLGDTDLLKEMKQIKCGGGTQQDLPDTVAGANGQAEIVEKFREVYSALYNSSGTQEGMDSLRAHVIVQHLIVLQDGVQVLHSYESL